MPSRRDFLKGAGALGASSILLGSSSRAAEAAPNSSSSGGTAKNLVFLVVDGMGTGTLSLAHHWQLRHKDSPLNWMQLYTRPGLTTALQDTASSSSPVTDSAAASSAWGCGQRVYNRSINTSDAGEPLTPLWTYAKQAGKATGLVSTCRITHATPAGFATNVPHRDMENEIADQYLEREIDVLLGGGLRHFSSDERDLLPEFEKKGYEVFTTPQPKAFGSRRIGPRVLGLFSNSHIPYAIDRENDEELRLIPGLDQMFQTALNALSPNEKGFVLQVEGGRVDHAGHGNDPAAILHEQLEFDRCIAVAERFLEQNPDTLFIVTTDHGTAGCQLNGWGDGYNDSGPALDRINRFTTSFEALEKHYRKINRFDPEHFEKMTGIQPSPEQVAKVQTALEQGVTYLNSAMTGAFARELLEMTAVGWTSSNHTSECVELLAMGPGSTSIPGFIKNYELHGVIREALGI